MMQQMYTCLQNRIPGWVVSLIIVLILSWFTLSPEIMMAAGVGWSLLYWLASLLWCFFKALSGSNAGAERQE
ncbi:MAG: hypothetical protein M1527_02070 [Gammaproteobacteria bacterium]|nr:hypothetical protein [Gammaproteobacteria bacterium]